MNKGSAGFEITSGQSITTTEIVRYISITTNTIEGRRIYIYHTYIYIYIYINIESSKWESFLQRIRYLVSC